MSCVVIECCAPAVTHFFNLKGPGGRGAAQMAVCSNPIQQPINSKSAQNQQGTDSVSAK